MPVETDFADWDLDTLSPADSSSLSLLFAEETKRYIVTKQNNLPAQTKAYQKLPHADFHVTGVCLTKILSV